MTREVAFEDVAVTDVPKRKPWLITGALAFVVLCACWHARRYDGIVIDDAFITFRHSLNLIRGNGFSCNAAVRVEGTSAPLYSLLISPFLLVGADPFAVAVALGIASFAAMCVIAYFIVRTCVQGKSSLWLGLGAAALTASSAPLAYHSQTGMETSLFGALMMLALFLYVSNCVRRQQSMSWALVMGFAALVRTEAVIYFLAWLVSAQTHPLPRTQRIRQAGRALLPFAIVVVPCFILRFAYFGNWVPTSVLAKSGRFSHLITSPSLHDIGALFRGDGTWLLVQYARTHSVSLALLPCCLLVPRARHIVLPTAALLLGGASLVNWSNGDWMPNYRQLTPCMAPLAVATFVGLKGLLLRDNAGESSNRIARLAAASALAGVAFLQNAKPVLTWDGGWNIVAMRTLGQQLSRFTLPTDWVATDSAGILAYYWGVNTIDQEGLCDAYIARHGDVGPNGTGRRMTHYVASRRPDWYIFQRLNEAVERYYDPQFTEYRDEYLMLQYPKAYLEQPGKPAHLPTIWVRKDHQGLEAIPATLGINLEPLATAVRHVADFQP